MLKKIFNISEKILPLNILTLIAFNFIFKRNYNYAMKKSQDKNIKLLSSIFPHLKKSDTLFILGSGSSINNISEAEWNHISCYDSVGFNFWFVHDFVPTFYVYEESHIHSRNQIFYKIIENKKDRYKNIPFIIKDLEQPYCNLDLVPNFMKTQIYASNSMHLVRGKLLNKKNFEKILLSLDKFVQKKNKNSTFTIFKRKASLSYLIYLGYVLKYKNIVLCGVDLNNSDYFFDNSELYGNVLHPKNIKTNVHATNMVNDGDIMTISEIIKVMNDVLLIPNDINLFILNKDSALSYFLPTYKI